jgi:uncharacterized membrane protein YfcA
MDFLDYIILLLAGIVGLVAGLASGFFGIGGGAIRIPLLNLIGFTLITSYGLNLISLPVGTLIGAVSQKENIDSRLGLYMILGGSIGTVVGTLIAFDIATSTLLLAIVFGIVSIIGVIGMNLHNIIPAKSESLHPSFANLFTGTLMFNTLTGMRGGSEGSLFVPLLRSVNVDMRKAISTALFAAIFTSIVGASLYLPHLSVLFIYGLIVLTGSAIGARIGSIFSLKTKSKLLERGLTIVIIVLALVPLLKLIIV